MGRPVLELLHTRLKLGAIPTRCVGTDFHWRRKAARRDAAIEGRRADVSEDVQSFGKADEIYCAGRKQMGGSGLFGHGLTPLTEVPRLPSGHPDQG